MADKDAYQKLADRTGIKPELLQIIPELMLDLSVINPITPQTLKSLGPILDLRPGQHILDLACGKGGATLPFVHTYQVKLLGVDLMPEYIREAWSKAEYTGLYDLCDFRTADAGYVLEVAQGQWEALFILGALPFISDDMNQALAAAKKLVKPGGHMVIGLPYLKDKDSANVEFPTLTKEETTRWLEKTGNPVEILDDGKDGWDYYFEPQKKNAVVIKQNNADNPDLISFINEWLKEQAWEAENLGYAVWVLKIEE